MKQNENPEDVSRVVLMEVDEAASKAPFLLFRESNSIRKNVQRHIGTHLIWTEGFLFFGFFFPSCRCFLCVLL